MRFGDIARPGRVDGDAGAAAAAVDVDDAARVDRRDGVARRLARPQHLAVGRVETLQGAGRGDEQFASCRLISASVGVLWVKLNSGRFFSHLRSPVLRSKASSRECLSFWSHCSNTTSPIEHRAATDGHVEGVRRNFLAPDRLAVVVERGQDGGAEQDVDAVGVGGRRRRRVAAAEVGQLPRPRLDFHVPQRRSIVGLIAGDVMLRVLLLRPRRPANNWR